MTVRALVLCEAGLLWWGLGEWTDWPVTTRIATTGLVWAALDRWQPGLTWALRRRIFRHPLSRLAVRAYFAFCLACMLGAAALLPVLLSYLLGLPVTAVTSHAAYLWWGDAFRITSTAVVACAFSLVIYGSTLGQTFVNKPRRRVPIPHLPPDLRGLRIVHITDLHLGHHLHGTQLRRYVRKVNALEPDLIAITGDILDHDPVWIDETLPDLAELRARYGVFAVLGNHDVYTGLDRVADGLRRHTDFTVLRDAWTAVPVGNATVYVVGLDDPSTHIGEWSVKAFPLADAMAGLPEDGPALLLCHRPDVWPLAVDAGIPLTLVGHTHGGQIAVPGVRKLSLARLITPFPSGWYEADGCHLYVNRGLGVAGSPIRIGAPREIALLELEPAPHHVPAADSVPQPAEAIAD